MQPTKPFGTQLAHEPKVQGATRDFPAAQIGQLRDIALLCSGFRPIKSAAPYNSFCRRPVMNTYAPSATNSAAVYNPLLPPVIATTFP
ncbi:MAG: hypothetical protein JWQ49_1399 [Edaphobacter sp.]|jgi:hypothetical protein|nr:hypothetical protein [Edaphobacter sp.]